MDDLDEEFLEQYAANETPPCPLEQAIEELSQYESSLMYELFLEISRPSNN